MVNVKLFLAQKRRVDTFSTSQAANHGWAVKIKSHTMNTIEKSRSIEINTALGHSRIYSRATIGGLPATKDKSEQYSRKQAADIFAKHEAVEVVEYVTTGKKTDSTFLSFGEKHSPAGIAVVVASTGGKWGKSRRDYLPA